MPNAQSIKAQIDKLTEKYNKAIDAENKAFKKLSAKKKRVAIARDVLEQLRLGTIKASPGTWVSATLKREAEGYDSAQKVLQNDLKSCQACALGAAFVCAVRLGNDLTVEEVGGDSYGSSDLLGIYDDSGIYEHLGKFFSTRQLDMMEAAFERGQGAVSATVPAAEEEGAYTADAEELSDEDADAYEADIAKAIAFTKGVRKAEDRLRMVMQNIIKNDGTFKP